MASNSPSPLEQLPTEILVMVANEGGLGLRDVIQLMATCRTIRARLRTPLVLYNAFGQMFDIPVAPVGQPGGIPPLFHVNVVCRLVGICKSLRGFDHMRFPRASRANSVRRSQERRKFVWACCKLVNDANLGSRSTESGNIKLLEKCVRQPRNSIVLYSQYDATDDGPVDRRWPMAPWLLMCLHLLFDPTQPSPHHPWGDLPLYQYHSYTTTSNIFLLREWIDTDTGAVEHEAFDVVKRGFIKVCAIVQFFRARLIYDGDIVPTFRDLPAWKRPTAWRHHIGPQRDVDLSCDGIATGWKGLSSTMSNAGINELNRMAITKDWIAGPAYVSKCIEQVSDTNSLDGFQTFQLEFPEMVEWPEDFDDMLPLRPTSLLGPKRPNGSYQNRRSRDLIPFVGRMHWEDDCLLLNGWIHAIPPFDVSGINHQGLNEYVPCELGGFRRMAFISIPATAERPDVSLRNLPADDPDLLLKQVQSIDWLHSDCYAYEGLMVPGSRMVVGQWRQAIPPLNVWHAATAAAATAADRGEQHHETSMTGPFLFWAVDGLGHEAEEKKEREEMIEYVMNLS